MQSEANTFLSLNGYPKSCSFALHLTISVAIVAEPICVYCHGCTELAKDLRSRSAQCPHRPVNFKAN